MELINLFVDMYRSLGLRVIPIPYSQKKAVIRWRRYQEEDPTEEDYKRWFSGGRTNLALICGAGGLVVLDFDEAGVYEKFFEGDDIENKTLVVETGKPGHYHVYLKSEKPCPSFKIPEIKLEVRSHGQYVIAPPSVHPSGKPYKFVNPDIKTLLPVKDVEKFVWDRAEKLGVKKPEDLIEEVIKDAKPYVGEDPPCISELYKGVDEGFRNEAAMRIASYLYHVKKITSRDLLLYKLEKWNKKNRPPLPKYELEAVVKSELSGKYKYGCRSLQGFCNREKCIFAWKKASKEKALELRKDPAILYKIKQMLDSVIVGEDENKLILFLAMMSKDLEDPLNVVLKAGSSGGKSWLVNRVADFFPESEIAKVSRVTPAALDYVKDRLKHKVFIVQQIGGAMSAKDSLHVQLTEKELVLWLPARGKGGTIDLKEVRAEGPTCFISTTTDMVLDPQLETRTLTLSVDESKEQTRRIHQFQALLDKKPWLREDIKRQAEVVKNVIKLGHHSPVHVVVPFSDRIEFPINDQRTRRDRVKFSTLIKACAYLHEEMRPKVTYRGKEYIIAFPADFYIAKEIGQKVLRETLLSLPKTLERILEVCRELEDDDEPITSKTVAAKAGCSIQTASRYLKDLNNIGYLSVWCREAKVNLRSMKPSRIKLKQIYTLT